MVDLEALALDKGRKLPDNHSRNTFISPPRTFAQFILGIFLTKYA